ncbi:MAG: CBS domain-containing protein [Candidatus Lokiarchaeota archaeon]|nr:CBS domain-containing protein [Candidatus Lokiarchaeota archaeon]
MVDIKVKDVYSEEDLGIIEEDTTLSKATSYFKDSTSPALIVKDKKGKYAGTISIRWLDRSKLDASRRKVKDLTRNVPKVDEHESLSEAARLMITSDSAILPVYSGERLKGYVSREDIIQRVVNEDWGSNPVSMVMTPDPVYVFPNQTVAQLLSTFRDHGFSHAPVVKNGETEGIVSLRDVIDIVYRRRQRSEGGFGGPEGRGGHGERSGESKDLKEIRLKHIMSSPVVAVRPSDSLLEAFEKMKKHDISSLAVVEDDELVGIMTKRDFLQPLASAIQEPTQVSVQFSIKPNIGISPEEQEVIRKEFSAFAQKYKDTVGIGGLYVHMKRYGPATKGDQHIQCKLQFYSPSGQFYGTAEAWSPEEAFRFALEKVERNLQDRKAQVMDEEYAARKVKEIMDSEWGSID